MLLGVDYQPGGQAGYKPQEGEDALSQGDVCLRDAAVMQVCRCTRIEIGDNTADLDSVLV